MTQSAVAILLLPLSAVGANCPYTATGWVKDVPVLPIMCTNAAAQVLLRGNAHTVAVQGTGPRLTGKRLVFANASYLPDGTAQVWGTAYQQVGTFDDQTNFTATAGLWEINYTGKMQADFSLNLSLAGYGSGGAIDGQRIEETMTRDPAGGPIDLAVPYHYTGTIKDAPVNTFEVLDNFDDNLFTGTKWGRGLLFETNQQFTAVGIFNVPTRYITDSYIFGGYTRTWAVPDGLTREWRADLVKLDDNGTNTAILAVATESGGYAFHLSRDFAFLLKWGPEFPPMPVLLCERRAFPTTNVVMALALTRMGSNLVITPRLLNKADPSKVLYDFNPVVDTPGSDPTISASEFQALSGMALQGLGLDRVEPPPELFYNGLLGVFQYTDGQQPIPTAVFDNLQLLTYEVPHISIAPAVQLTWPAPAGAYSVEWAPYPDGPWQPFQVLLQPGLQQLTARAGSAAGYFRARQAP